MRTYKIRLLKCSGKDQKISAYLQLLTGLDKVMANRIVSNLPATLFDNLDEEGMEYFKEAFDFYEVEYREARTCAIARPAWPRPAAHRAGSRPVRPRAAGSWPP